MNGRAGLVKQHEGAHLPSRAATVSQSPVPPLPGEFCAMTSPHPSKAEEIAVLAKILGLLLAALFRSAVLVRRVEGLAQAIDD
jgi:hypothetical protein